MMVMILLTIERDQIRESEKELYMSMCVHNKESIVACDCQ